MERLISTYLIILFAVGGFIWIVFGGILSTSLTNALSVPNSIAIFLSFGVVLLAFGTFLLYRTIKHPEIIIRVIMILTLIGGFLYFLGSLISFIRSSITGEITATVGFFMYIFSMFIFSVDSTKMKYLSTSFTLPMGCSAVILFFFNHQVEMAWLAIAFGFLWTIVAAFMLFKRKKFHSFNQDFHNYQ